MEPSRAVRRYYAYFATTSIGLYIPVGVVFLSEVRGFGLDAIGTVMAAYLFGMVLGELPTGYLGDRMGQRESLAVGNAIMASSLVAWAFLQTPLQYAILNVVWAIGTTFRSGTADAWLYEYLDARELPPPKPLRETLERLEALEDETVLVQFNDRVPQHLYPRLTDRGYTFETLNDDVVVTAIWREAD